MRSQTNFPKGSRSSSMPLLKSVSIGGLLGNDCGRFASHLAAAWDITGSHACTRPSSDRIAANTASRIVRPWAVGRGALGKDIAFVLKEDNQARQQPKLVAGSPGAEDASVDVGSDQGLSFATDVGL